jgi:hypothetical protein
MKVMLDARMVAARVHRRAEGMRHYGRQPSGGSMRIGDLPELVDEICTQTVENPVYKRPFRGSCAAFVERLSDLPHAGAQLGQADKPRLIAEKKTVVLHVVHGLN